MMFFIAPQLESSNEETQPNTSIPFKYSHTGNEIKDYKIIRRTYNKKNNIIVINMMTMAVNSGGKHTMAIRIFIIVEGGKSCDQGREALSLLTFFNSESC